MSMKIRQSAAEIIINMTGNKERSRKVIKVRQTVYSSQADMIVPMHK